MMMQAKIVHHQQTRRVGLSSLKMRWGGGSLYNDIVAVERAPRLKPGAVTGGKVRIVVIYRLARRLRGVGMLMVK